MKFNKKQELAIHFGLGAGAIIAGAGSGKSTVLTYRTENLVKHLDTKEEDILVISFTSGSRENMIKKLSEIGVKNVQVHTFHSLCRSIMIKEGYDCNIFMESGSENDKYKVSSLFRNHNIALTNGEISNIFNFIGFQKRYGISYDGEFKECELMISDSDMRHYFKIYEDYKIKHKKTDFEDWINTTVNILENTDKYTYKFLMCDEHQDTNLIQNKLIKLLCPSNNIVCVFDYRQSIFGFSGANPEYCMNFDSEYVNSTIINLDINYRSARNIVDNANKFIREYYKDYKYYSDSIWNNENDGVIEKISSYSRDEESKIILNKIKELLAKGEDPNDIAILYRLSSHSDYIAKDLKSNKIKFDIKNDSSFFLKKEVDFIMLILRLIENSNDDEAFEKLYNSRATDLKFLSKNKDFTDIKNKSGRYNLSLFQSLTDLKFNGLKEKVVNSFIKNIEKLKLQRDRNMSIESIIDNICKLFDIDKFIETNWEESKFIEHKESVETLKSFAKGNSISSLLKFANGESKKYNKEDKDGIKLMTIHKSKGLEFKHVFVMGIEDGKFPHDKSPLLEEARLFYVAITRAKENLTISQIYEGNRFVEEYFNYSEVLNDSQTY